MHGSRAHGGTRRRRALAIALITGLFCASILASPWFIPARWVIGPLLSQTPVSLSGVHGSLVHGRARYALLPRGTLQKLRWTLDPSALLSGRIAARVRAGTDHGTLTAHLETGPDGALGLRHVRGRAGIDWVAHRLGLVFSPLSGRARLALRRLAFDAAHTLTALHGRLQLTRLAWQLRRPPIRLGRVDLVLTHIGHGVAATVVESRGPLAITGRIHGRANGRYDVHLRLRTRPGADPRLVHLIDRLPPASRRGWHRLSLAGSLPAAGPTR